MKESWEYKKLDDICTIVGRIGFRGYTKADLVKSSKDGAITLSPSNIIDGELDFSKCTYINWDKYYESPEIMLENGDIVLVKTASIGKCAVVRNLSHEATLNPQFVVLKQIIGIPDFICYYLKSSIAQNTIKQMAGGVAIPTLSQKKLGMMIVPVPSQSEQQSIVEYLDSSFAKIDAMKANAEKALNEAKALFQASLKEMLEPKKGWEEKTIGSFAKIVHGKNQKEVLDDNGLYPIYGSGGNIMGYANSYLCDAGTTILGRKGTIDNPLFIEEKFWNVDTAFGIIAKENCNKKFLYYSIKKVDWAKRNTGTTLPSLTQNVVYNVEMCAPSLLEQESIVNTLDTLKIKVDRLQENFDKISQECDALKQAILRQVFE